MNKPISHISNSSHNELNSDSISDNMILYHHDIVDYQERIHNLMYNKKQSISMIDAQLEINKQKFELDLQPTDLTDKIFHSDPDTDSDFLKSDDDEQLYFFKEDMKKEKKDIELLNVVASKAFQEELFFSELYNNNKLLKDNYDKEIKVALIQLTDLTTNENSKSDSLLENNFKDGEEKEILTISDMNLESQYGNLTKSQKRKIKKNLKVSLFTNDRCEAIDVNLYINCHEKDTTKHLIKSQAILRDYLSAINILIFKRTEKLKKQRATKLYLTNQIQDLKHIKEASVVNQDLNYNRKRLKKEKEEGILRSRPNIALQILIFSCIFNLITPSLAYFPCPNRGRQIEFLEPKINSTQYVQKRYSACQTPLTIDENQELIAYLDIKRPCIWPINNFTEFIIDTQMSTWRIYQYGNVLIDKGSLTYDARRVAGVYATTNKIYVQFSDTNYSSVIRNSTRARTVNSLEAILALTANQVFINTINNQYQIHTLLLNDTSSFFRWSTSQQQYVLEDGFQDCFKVQQENQTGVEVNYTDFNRNEVIIPIYQNLSEIAIINNFLKVNHFELRQIPKQSKRARMLAGATQKDFNGLMLKVTDNMLQGCSLISGDGGGSMSKSCLYRVIIEEKGVGHLVFQDPQFGLAALSYPIEIYTLKSNNNDCYDTEASFEYKCKCCTKTAFCGTPGTNWQKFIFDTSTYSHLIGDSLDDAVMKGKINLETESKIYNQGGTGCSTPWDAKAAIITKQRLTGSRSRIFSINLEDTCAYVTPIFIKPDANKVMATTGVNYCHTQEKYNSIRGDYNITIFSLQNNQPKITEDYVRAHQNGSYGSFQSSQYVVDGSFTNAICKAKIDKDLNIVLPEVKYQFDEVSCQDDIMNHRILDDYIIKEQNTSKLYYFTRFTKIIPFNYKFHFFAPIQYTQNQVRGGQGTGNNNIFVQVKNKLCVPQMGYAANLKRLVQLLYCFLPDKQVDELMIIDNNQNIANQKVILFTIDLKVVCHDPNNSEGLCEDIRFKEHAMRFIDFAQIDAEVQVKGLWMGMPDVELRAKDCKVAKAPEYKDGAIREGRICCANDGLLKMIIDNGVDQFVQNVNTQNKCWDFAQNAVYVHKVNTEKYVIKIPNLEGLSNQNIDMTNTDFKAASFTTTDGYNIKNYNPSPPSKLDSLLTIIFYWSVVSLIWFIINAMIYAYEVHSKSIADGKPGFLYLICGGGIISALMACIANSRLLKWKKRTTQKLSIEDDLFKHYKDKLIKKAQKKKDSAIIPLDLEESKNMVKKDK